MSSAQEGTFPTVKLSNGARPKSEDSLKRLFCMLSVSVACGNKLWPEDYGYETAKKAFQKPSSQMGVEYLDVYMLHWPDSMQPGCSNRELRAESWRALEELIEQRLCRSVGVSNCMIHHLEQLKQDCTVVPHINQVEYHPYQQPNKLMEYRQGITFQGYCPLAKGQALSDPTIIQLAQKYGRTPAQICIRWSIQNGAITKVNQKGACSRKLSGVWIPAGGRQETIKNLHDGRRVSWDPTNVE